MKNINFVPKDVQRILSSYNISENYNEQTVFYKKIVLNNFAIFTEKCLCWGFFSNKNEGLQAWNFIKKRLLHKCVLVNIDDFLKNTYFEEHLWTASSESFSFYVSLNVFLHDISYIGDEKDVFSKTTQNKKTF